VVVVVPGIQGTQLFRQGEPIWAISGAAFWHGLITRGEAIRRLALPADIGDECPDDGVEPRGLMPDLHGIPGVGPFIGGYSDVSRWLRKNLDLHPFTAGESGNLIEFGYDWRLSNRYTSERLKSVVEKALYLRREDGHPKAKLVFYCHSMGGLVARHYLEVLGGGEHTKALVTVGTPHQGSLKAVDNLVNGRTLGVGPVRLDVASLARTFPSAYQLLPTYRCIAVGEERKDLRTALPPNLERQRVADALAFHEEIATSATANGGPPYALKMIVGTRQPTYATGSLTRNGIEPLFTIDGNDALGDGTVSRFASIPVGVDPEDPRQVSSSKRHGWLQQSSGVLDDFYGIVTASPRVYMSDVPDIGQAPGLEVPEVAASGETLEVRAHSASGRLRLEAVLTGEDGTTVARAKLDNLGDGRYGARLDPPAAGLYTVTVAGLAKDRFDPVTEAVLVTEVDAHG
jgi:pimeloyl-ACP methyl ester carboxylesterase